MKKKNKKLWNKVENTKNKWGYQNFMEYKKLDDLWARVKIMKKRKGSVVHTNFHDDLSH